MGTASGVEMASGVQPLLFATLGQWRQRVPRSLQEKLKHVAAREGVSLNAYVAGVLAEYVGRVG